MKPELPILIDSTMISTFRQCGQKFFDEFCLGLRPGHISIDLHAGACFASGLEHTREFIYLEKMPLEEALLRAHVRFLQEWGTFEPIKDTPKTKDNVWFAVEEYFRHYPPLTDHVQPFIRDGKPTFEFTFAIPLEPTCSMEEYHDSPKDYEGHFPLHPSGSPFIYGGRFDLLGSYFNLPCVEDDKTTTGIGPTWATQWDLRSQFKGYVWACQQSGIKLDTVVVRGVGLLKKEIKFAEAVKQYPDWQIARWHEQLRRDLWRIRRQWDEGYFDYNLADACSQYGGCAFLDLCRSKTPENWMNNYRVHRWNPLSKNPVEPEKWLNPSPQSPVSQESSTSSTEENPINLTSGSSSTEGLLSRSAT